MAQKDNMPRAKKKPTEISFEALMTELESTVEQLEQDELPLEKAIEAYQKGVELAKSGYERLNAAEKRIEEVTKNGNLKALSERDVLEDDDELL
ncbi:MAG: exodeoxyribonuclease VII small subunit [Myxococcota bacterium]|nr:exodeoxyribonuclease VII small subunit [Myxococcota bacterium]